MGAEQLPRACRVVVDAAARGGLDIEIHTFPAGTKTAADAAAAVGCEVGAIVKSLVFLVDDEPVVALVPGDRRLDTDALAAVVGAAVVERAPLDRVREATGFAAGGTPPFGHANELAVHADPALRSQEVLWAAGGTPDTVFPIAPADLDRLARPNWTAIST